MREIKFKAYHKEEKVLCDVTNLNSEGAFLVGVKKGKDEYYNGKYVVYAPEGGRFCLNEEIELLQYIGLKDENGTGVEIYEGYIVEGSFTDYEGDNYDFVDEIIFDLGKFQCVNNADFDLYVYDLKVIGNIYENSNLLK